MRKITNVIDGELNDVYHRANVDGSGPRPSSPTWRRSSYCNFERCVVLADLDGYVAVRDPDDPRWMRIVPRESVLTLDGHVAMANLHDPDTMLIVQKAAWAQWIRGIKAGELDDLVALDA